MHRRMLRSATLSALACGALTCAEDTILPALTVTAAKIEASPSEIPGSVTVTDGQTLSDRGDRSLDDLSGTVPGMTTVSYGTHTTYPVIRGITGLSDESPAAVVIDGISPRGFGLDGLLDVEQVEVLRGPQGTLYGRNTIPGVVAVKTRDPGASWEGYSRLDAGSFRTAGATAAAGGPISNSLGIRLAARGERSDGWRTNDTTADDRTAARRDAQAQGTVRWDLGQGWSARLGVIGARYRTSADLFAPLTAERNHTRNDYTGEWSNDVNAADLTIERRSEAMTITAITGAAADRDINDLDIDFSAVPGSTLRKDYAQRMLSQELRLSGGGGLHAWVLGLFADRTAQQVDAPLTTRLPAPMPPSLSYARSGTQTSTDGAIFGQAGIALGPGWTLTLGLRLEHDRQAVEYASTDSLGGLAGGTFSSDERRSDTEALPKAALSYAWTPTVLTWISATRGFKAGGYNLTPMTQAEISGGYGPESAWTYEIGQSAEILDRRLRCSLDAFRTDYRDKQVSISAPPTFIIVNAAAARVDGVEGELTAIPLPGLQISSAVAMTRAVFTDYVAAGVDRAGQRLPMAAAYTANLGVQWRSEGGWFVRTDGTLFGSSYLEETATVDQDAYGLLALRVGYEAQHWGAYLWGRNLADQGYLTRGVVQGGQQIGVGGEPRAIGISAQASF